MRFFLIFCYIFQICVLGFIVSGLIIIYLNLPEPLEGDDLIYVGTWVGEDDTEIKIRESGTGDYKTSGKSFSRSIVTIENNTLEMNIFFTKEIFDIYSSPGDFENESVMILNGEEFTRKED